MKSAIRTVTLLAVVVLMAAIPAHAQTPTLAIGKDSFLQLRAVTGEIEVARAAGPEVVVTAIREGGAAEPRVVLIEDGKGFTLCTVSPANLRLNLDAAALLARLYLLPILNR